MTDLGKSSGGQGESLLLSEIRTLYFVSSLLVFYGSTKQKHQRLAIGLSLVERTIGFFSLVFKIEKVRNLDHKLGTYLRKLKRTSEKTMEPQIEDHRPTSSMFINGLDSLIHATESLLYKLDPSERPPTKHKLSIVEKVKAKELIMPTDSPMTVARKTPLPSEQSDDENDLAYEKDTKANETSTNDQNDSTNQGFMHLVIIPVRYLVICLRAFRRFLVSPKHIKERSRSLSPEKNAEIQARRKVSPRKRIQGNTFSYIRHVANRLVGMKQSSTLSSSKMETFLEMSKGKNIHINDEYEEDGDNKRKHDEILTEDDCDSEDDKDDLKDLDLENYVSDEDPDYEPGEDAGSDDSCEFSEGDTESDIEFEVIDSIRQIKVDTTASDADEHKKEKVSRTASETDEHNNEKVMNGDRDNATDDMKKTDDTKKTDDAKKPAVKSERKKSTGGKKDNLKNKARARKSQGSQSDEKKPEDTQNTKGQARKSNSLESDMPKAEIKGEKPMPTSHRPKPSGDHRDVSKPEKVQHTNGDHKNINGDRH